jgi:hypothetical protein
MVNGRNQVSVEQNSRKKISIELFKLAVECKHRFSSWVGVAPLKKTTPRKVWLRNLRTGDLKYNATMKKLINGVTGSKSMKHTIFYDLYGLLIDIFNIECKLLLIFFSGNFFRPKT